MVPDDVLAFGRAVASELSSASGDELVGAWFVGSVALDGYVPRESDVDVLAVCRGRLDLGRREAIARRLTALLPSCPARGLELTLYRREVLRTPPSAPVVDFELNVNGGPRMEQSVRFERGDQANFWWVLDRAVAHRRGVAICGPPASDVVGDVDRRVLLSAMVDSMRWHRANEPATLYSVLNACRAWHFAVEDRLVSKLEGAAWARERWPDAAVIDAAVALRRGEPGSLRAEAVAALLDHVEVQLGRAV